jgi:hypothetical protein
VVGEGMKKPYIDEALTTMWRRFNSQQTVSVAITFLE